MRENFPPRRRVSPEPEGFFLCLVDLRSTSDHRQSQINVLSMRTSPPRWIEASPDRRFSMVSRTFTALILSSVGGCSPRFNPTRGTRGRPAGLNPWHAVTVHLTSKGFNWRADVLSVGKPFGPRCCVGLIRRRSPATARSSPPGRQEIGLHGGRIYLAGRPGRRGVGLAGFQPSSFGTSLEFSCNPPVLGPKSASRWFHC